MKSALLVWMLYAHVESNFLKKAKHLFRADSVSSGASPLQEALVQQLGKIESVEQNLKFVESKLERVGLNLDNVDSKISALGAMDPSRVAGNGESRMQLNRMDKIDDKLDIVQEELVELTQLLERVNTGVNQLSSRSSSPVPFIGGGPPPPPPPPMTAFSPPPTPSAGALRLATVSNTPTLAPLSYLDELKQNTHTLKKVHEKKWEGRY